MLKDVRLCLAEAHAAGVPFPAAAHAGELLAAAVDAGHGGEDYAALIEAAERVAGRRL
jgi:3-hydroxyisobutyrate dehydrogenase